MPQITLNTAQVNELAAFIKKHKLDTFFLAKDDGAYVGATATDKDGNLERVIFYFRGMNPEKDEFAWETARDAFGGDDFGEHLNAAFILKMADKIEPKVTIKVTATQIKMDGTAKKVATKPAAAKAPPTNVKGETKGAQIRRMLAEGMSIDLIVRVVGTTANSVRWHKSKMNAEAS